MNKKFYFNPLVSVIINCHNASKYIPQSIKSVLKQSYRNLELIVYDNFSKDKTNIIVKKFKKDKRVRYYKSKSFLNLYHARNLAIKKTRGELVAFLDADDWWEKEKLQKQINFLSNKKNVNIVYSNLFLYEEKKKKKKIFSQEKLYNGKITQQLLNNFKMPILTVLAKKKIFQKYKFNKRYNIIGDFDLFIRVSLKENIYSLQEPLAFYRVHSSSMSSQRVDLNISELKNWFNENRTKKIFEGYNFQNVQKKIYTLKIKNEILRGKKFAAFKELIKRPFNSHNLKFFPLFFVPNKIIKFFFK